MHSTIIFHDTNTIQQLTYKLLCGETDSEVDFFRSLCLHHTCVISSFVVFELWKTLIRRYEVEVDKSKLLDVLEEIGFSICPSDKFHRGQYMIYVHDFFDEQILLDAVFNDATILYTKNLADFDITMILSDLNIVVTDSLSIFSK